MDTSSQASSCCVAVPYAWLIVSVNRDSERIRTIAIDFASRYSVNRGNSADTRPNLKGYAKGAVGRRNQPQRPLVHEDAWRYWSSDCTNASYKSRGSKHTLVARTEALFEK